MLILVHILLSGVFGRLPKCASNGEIYNVFCLLIRNWFITEFIELCWLSWDLAVSLLPLCISSFGSLHGLTGSPLAAWIIFFFKFSPLLMHGAHFAVLVRRSRFIYDHQAWMAILVIRQLPEWVLLMTSIYAPFFGIWCRDSTVDPKSSWFDVQVAQKSANVRADLYTAFLSSWSGTSSKTVSLVVRKASEFVVKNSDKAKLKLSRWFPPTCLESIPVCWLRQ